jgi:hypothetical protein
MENFFGGNEAKPSEPESFLELCKIKSKRKSQIAKPQLTSYKFDLTTHRSFTVARVFQVVKRILSQGRGQPEFGWIPRSRIKFGTGCAGRKVSLESFLELCLEVIEGKTFRGGPFYPRNERQ